MRTNKAEQPITRADLARSGVDCRRVETEVSRPQAWVRALGNLDLYTKVGKMVD